jgi:hypothetical protein
MQCGVCDRERDSWKGRQALGSHRAPCRQWWSRAAAPPGGGGPARAAASPDCRVQSRKPPVFPPFPGWHTPPPRATRCNGRARPSWREGPGGGCGSHSWAGGQQGGGWDGRRGWVGHGRMCVVWRQGACPSAPPPAGTGRVVRDRPRAVLPLKGLSSGLRRREAAARGAAPGPRHNAAAPRPRGPAPDCPATPTRLAARANDRTRGLVPSPGRRSLAPSGSRPFVLFPHVSTPTPNAEPMPRKSPAQSHDRCCNTVSRHYDVPIRVTFPPALCGPIPSLLP